MKVTRAGVDRSTTYLPEELNAVTVQLAGWDGQVGQGSVPIPDPAGNQEPYEGEQLLIEQDSLTIVDGFLGAITSKRGGTAAGTRRVHTMTLGDDNALLAGHATPGWSRPAEAPAARWLAFVNGFLPVGIDTTWLLTTNESGVTLPKKTYRTDSLFDDLSADTIGPTGKTAYIEARRFHWHLPTEGQTCAIVIHDTNPYSSTSFQPLTLTRSKDGMDLRNKISARNDAGVVVSVSDATSITRHDSGGIKHQGYAEYGTETAAEMTRDIGVTLAERKEERITWEYEIGPMTAAQAIQLIPGSQMTVTVAVHGLSASVQRIARVTLKYQHGADSRHFTATVELGYPKRLRRKPTKTTSPADSTGGSGVGGTGDCGCPPVGTRCCVEFDLPSASGMGGNRFDGTPWSADTAVVVASSKAAIPQGSDPYSAVPVASPIEILVHQSIVRGTTANSSMSVNPASPAATDHDVACRLTLLHNSITNLGIEYTDLMLEMCHADHGGVLAADLYLYLEGNGSSVAPTVLTGVPLSSIWTRFRIEDATATSSKVSVKAWGGTFAAEPPTYQLTFNQSWIRSGLPHTLDPNLLVFDNRTGANETVWSIDSVCFIEGLPCGDPTTGQLIPWTKVANGDGSTTAFATPDPYMVGTLEARVDAHQVTVAESGAAQGTLGFAPVTSESVYYRYRRA